MAKRFNGLAKWIIVAIAVFGLAFNSGILYNDVKHLSSSVDELKVSYVTLNEKFDKLLLSLAERSKE